MKKALLLSALLSMAAAANAGIYSFDLSGIYSNDVEGAAINEHHSLFVGENAHVVGIGWEADLYADSPSYLSEMMIGFSTADSSGNFLYLTPSATDDSGSEFTTSNGIVDLTQYSYDFNVGSDGLLNMEFFEYFDDYEDSWDGLWNSGTLTVQTEAVPEPASMAALGLGALALVRRRRKSA